MLDQERVRAAAKENLEVKSREFFERNPRATTTYAAAPGDHVVTVVTDDRVFPGHGVSYEDALGEALLMAIFFEQKSGIP